MPPQQAVNTQAGDLLIKDFEGFRPDAYQDPKDGWALPTIGYGTTAYANGRRVQRGDTISEPQAVAELENFVQAKILPSLQMIPHFSEMTQLNGSK